MSINQELLNFASTRPLWQQDLLRRICTQRGLTSIDIREILAQLKSTEELETTVTSQPLSEDHLSNRTMSSRSTTVLTSISDVRCVNRLTQDQTLLFATSGITLIYGYNGSGKTGYARILKQVCRSRHEKVDPILGDVYATAPSKPASARIDYYSDDTHHSVQWQDGSPTPKDLSHISVFDSSTAPLYADRQNKIEFLPLGLDVLPRLAKACDELSALLLTEVETIDRKLAASLPKVTSEKYIKLLSRFSATTASKQVPTERELRTEFTWDQDDEAVIAKIEEEMRLISAPAQQAGQLRRLKRSLEGLKVKIDTSLSRFTSDNITSYQECLTRARIARQAATLAATEHFSHDPVSDAPTTAAWRKLYESAEAFSAIVYPGEDFPVTGDGKVCVLCQQPLDNVSSERLKRFKLFLQDTTQRDADREEKRLAEFTRQVEEIAIVSEKELQEGLSEFLDVRQEAPALESKLKGCIHHLEKLRADLLSCLAGEASFKMLPPVDPSAVLEIEVIVNSLDSEVKILEEKTKDNSVLNRLKKQHAELLDRKSCTNNYIIFEGRRSDLGRLNALKRCKNQCDTKMISRKATVLRETYLTEDFRTKIKEEIEHLGLGYLPVVVQGRTDRGTGYIGVALSQASQQPTSRILSEGEFRGLALACFFAEIRSIDGHDGIVVDDPVSSLDHLHVEQVANRLVAQAKVRPQVIIFTHDLSFYYALWLAAAEAQIPIHRNWIHRDGSTGFGTVVNEDGPWQIKKVKERLRVLDEMLDNLPDQSSCLAHEWQKKTEEFYSKLRETWERLVEECLLNGVVGRFQPGVATQSLKGVAVTGDDYRTIFFAMKKASEFSGHDHAVGRLPVVRTKDQMKNDKGELWKYEKDLKKRTKEIEDERRKLETPPPAEVVAPLGKSVPPKNKTLDSIPLETTTTQ